MWLSACSTPVDVKPRSMHSTRDETREWKFDAADLKRVEIRSAVAEDAEVTRVSDARAVTIAARPTGGVMGYHPADPNWRETSPEDWGMDFVARRFGSRLIISSRNEISYIHHHYSLSDIRISVPQQVQVKLVNRELTGDGAPDLDR